MKCDARRSSTVVRSLATVVLTGALAAVPAQAGIDDVLRTRIEEQARSDRSLARAEVVVRVQRRDVLLSGTVRLYLQKMTYERIAWHTQGVMGVENEIQVVPALPATDEEIRQTITHLLVEEKRFHGMEIKARVNDGRVSLNGTFHGLGEVLLLKRRVAAIEGVLDIEIDAKVLA